MKKLFWIIVLGLVFLSSGCTTTTTQRTVKMTPAEDRYSYLTTYKNRNSPEMAQEIFEVGDRICLNSVNYDGETITYESATINEEIFDTSVPYHVVKDTIHSFCFTPKWSLKAIINIKVRGIITDSKYLEVSD